jgi:hypothetical protein
MARIQWMPKLHFDPGVVVQSNPRSATQEDCRDMQQASMVLWPR